jgi:hypothetical protein
MTAADMAATRAFLASPAATRTAESESVPPMIRVISGHSGPRGLPCRVIEQAVQLNGQMVRAIGTVCEQSNGLWALMP